MQYLFDAITCDALRGDEMRMALDASKFERSRQRDNDVVETWTYRHDLRRQQIKDDYNLVMSDKREKPL